MRFRSEFPPLAVGCLVILAGCGTPSAGSTPAHVSTFDMTHPRVVVNTHGSNPDSFYIPNPIRVRTGQTITWKNTDTDPHDVTSYDGLFFSNPMANGATWSWTPRRPGTYRYFCTLHPEMHGEIIVSR